ncbi:hypothetical protein F4808DRAFT_396233 [Astrocystis sublimbata]|nr:hypothetical protein F4808DRAFT_396233 [Astrocystis sublimbata]
MLPPVDDSVLKNNPRFQQLYHTLTTAVLNPDGSTKIDPAAEKRDAVSQELKAYRLKAARVHLLRTAISTAVPSTSNNNTKPIDNNEQQKSQPKQHRRLPSRTSQLQQSKPTPQTLPSLPPDLHELLLLLPPFLTHATTLSPSSLTLLLTSPPFPSLPLLFPQLLTLLSTSLTRLALTLTRVLSPSTNPSYTHRLIPTLPTLTSTLLSTYSQTQTTHLPLSRQKTLSALQTHSSLHNTTLSLLTTHLEHKHGPIASYSVLQAQKAELLAKEQDLAAHALRLETQGLIYPAEARSALDTYRHHLRDAGRRLEDAIRVREVQLGDYGVSLDDNDGALNNGGDEEAVPRTPARGHRRRATKDENKERTMREMARVYKEMETRLLEIQGDLHRLK